MYTLVSKLKLITLKMRSISDTIKEYNFRISTSYSSYFIKEDTDSYLKLNNKSLCTINLLKLKPSTISYYHKKDIITFL